MKNKVFAFLLSFFIIFGSVLSITAFGISDWAKEYVQKYQSYGLSVSALGNNYEQDITRQQFSSIVVSLYEKTKGEININDNVPFKDTSDLDVKKAYTIGIVKGVSQDSFMPEDNITRQDICVMFDRLINLVSPDISVTMQYVIFEDESTVSDYAKNSIQFLYKLNVINGMGGEGINI
jgi:hypothetical protein